MPRTGNPYLREEDLCSDEEGVDELVQAMTGLSCRRSGMPPVVHAYATSHVVVQTMSCQCALGRESLINIRPRPELDAPPPSSSSSTSTRGSEATSTKTPSDSKSTTSTAIEAPVPRDVSAQPTSPADAPPPADTPMDVDGAAAEAEVVVQPAAKRSKKRNRRRKKPRPATPAFSDARQLIEKKQDEDRNRARTEMLLEAGFNYDTPSYSSRRQTPSRPSTPLRGSSSSRYYRGRQVGVGSA